MQHSDNRPDHPGADHSVTPEEHRTLPPTSDTSVPPKPGSLPPEALERMRHYRHDRLVACMAARNVPSALYTDPVNIRYATDSRNMQVYALNHDVRSVFIAGDGYTVLFDWYVGDVYFGGLPIDEARVGMSYGFLSNGDDHLESATATWASEIASLVRTHSPDDLRLGVDRLIPIAVAALAAEGITVIDGQAPIYEARSIKSADEIAAMRIAMAACDDGFVRMRARTRPGATEVEIWAGLHEANVEWEGEWINARLMTTGPRTNPWAQETSLRLVERGDIIGCDSDIIGPYGYAADISRTWIASGKPTDRQRRIYALGYEHVHRNIELFQPGASFLEIMNTNYLLPQKYQEQMFSSLSHGIGLENEWPIIRSVHKADVQGGYGGGYDGEILPGMTISIESYIGEVGGPDGVKLEEQIHITEKGPVIFSRTPYELDWL